MRTLLVMAMFLALAVPALAGEVDLKKAFPNEVKQAEDKLRDLGHGNERSAEITKAVLNTDNGDVTVDANIRSRHRVRGGPPWARYDVTVFDWTVSGTVKFNWRAGGQVDGQVDFGRGIKVSVRDIATILAGAK